MFGRLLFSLAGLTLAGCATPEPAVVNADMADIVNGKDLLVRVSTPTEDGDEYSLSATATMIPTINEWLSTCEEWDKWDKSAPPFRIHGETYYVGTCGIGAILILSEDGLMGDDLGHILIDSGTLAGADVVLENIRALGIDPSEVSVLLSTHSHFDHVGGMAKMQEATGADVFAVALAAKVLSTGRDNPADPQFGMHPPMEPVRVSRILAAGEKVELGALTVNPVTTPGHTPDAMSWHWEDCDDDDCKSIVYADSLSPVSADGYRFSDHPEYLAAFRSSIERIAALDCDILLTPHPSHSKMVKRAATGTLEGGMSCAEYAESKTRALDARLAKEAEATE